jgi:hypothetical protein
MRPSPRACDGGVVTGFLLKTTVCLVIIGVVCFDLVSVGVSRMALEDQAAAAARSAAAYWRDDHNTQAAFEAAQATAAEADPGNVVDPGTFEVADDGSVRLSAARTAHTFLARHVPQLRSWISLRADAHAAPPS